MTAGRGIDHLVLVVRDLEEAARRYEAMGFLVGARNRHPWGTENRIMQLRGSFLELITVGEGASFSAPGEGEFGFGAFIDCFLRDVGEGFAMLVLASSDARGDASAFRAAGIGAFEPFFFERMGIRADGSKVRVAFTLAFAAEPSMPHAGFFVSEQHEPQNFWSESLQRHSNGAAALSGVIAVADRPEALAPFLAAFSGSPPACVGPRNVAITTPRGTIEAMTPDCFRDVVGIEPGLPLERGARLAAFKIVAPIAPFEARLDAAGIPALRQRRHLVVAPEHNFGAALIIEEPRAAA